VSERGTARRSFQICSSGRMASPATTLISSRKRMVGFDIGGDWTPAERQRTQELAETKYRSQDWSEKR